MIVAGDVVSEKVADETPDTVHGRLLEAVHIAGYTWKRACTELDWMLDEGRWMKVGPGFTDINEFLATIDLSEFRIIAEQRKSLARKLKALEAANVATAKALGVDEGTIRNDTRESENSESEPTNRTIHALPVAQESESSDAQTMAVMSSSESPEWATPQDFFDELDAEFAFGVDVCANASNAKCERYFSPVEDGLAQEWRGVCWMNSPYGDEIAVWVRKARESAEAGAVVVCLVPARVDTAWWWDNCWQAEIRFVRGRLRFGAGDVGAPFPSAVVVFGRPANIPSTALLRRQK